MSERSVYFPGLHGLRFIAALAVVIGHVELLKRYFGYANRAESPAIYELGRISVTFFFVLSGFLITYILLAEKRDTGTVSLKKFYLRRILRIWPLYYLMILMAFAIVPRVRLFDVPILSDALHEHSSSTLPLFLAFLPQVALSLFPPVPYVEPLWSIGVEEQFYLLWPALVARLRRFVPAALLVIAAGVIAKEAALRFASTLHDADRLRFWNHVIDYFYFTRLECMAIGGIAGWLAFGREHRMLSLLHSRPVQAIAYVLGAYAVMTAQGKPLLHYSAHAALFAVMILNIATNPRSFVTLRHPIFTFLGNISYAVYMLHELAIRVVMRAQIGLGESNFQSAGSNAILYIGSVLLTVAAATLVYHAVELPFLRMKRRFAVLATGPQPSTRMQAGAQLGGMNA